MNWDRNYEALMRAQGIEPYGCLRLGCQHVSRGTFGMLVHHLFGTHGQAVGS